MIGGNVERVEGVRRRVDLRAHQDGEAAPFEVRDHLLERAPQRMNGSRTRRRRRVRHVDRLRELGVQRLVPQGGFALGDRGLAGDDDVVDDFPGAGTLGRRQGADRATNLRDLAASAEEANADGLERRGVMGLGQRRMQPGGEFGELDVENRSGVLTSGGAKI